MDARIEIDSKGRKSVRDGCDEPCAIEQGMAILGGKWTASILWHLRDEPVRFNDLARMISGSSKKMVSERLRHLEAHGLIRRTVIETKPVAVSYSITDRGQAAIGILEELQRWTEQHAG
ncbi:helix-turn-helix domain-containing protein [Parasphingopyxis sp.]|uniref:winged helix-turn-helix transcriptional regulator n=1 Tax=Parasphingopyxis sp. TaxID=1920299 RepID=UPI0026080A12|nr:helix-turn-helix domain-containing protein [Parasphingopyxis sp.]